MLKCFHRLENGQETKKLPNVSNSYHLTFLAKIKTHRDKIKGNLVRHKVYANALYDIDRLQTKRSSNAESHKAFAKLKARDRSDAMFFKSLVEFNGTLT